MNNKPPSVKLLFFYTSKGKGGTGGIEVHFTVKKKCERFSEGKDFYGFWWIFLKNKKILASGV